ncbi:MAG: nitroreductase/quinone reductase family protein [Dehalococcoidia bacterium]
MMPAGLIVLETKGRRSGQRRSIPLHAVSLGDYLLVSTLRRQRSQWFRNVSVDPDVRYWRGGEAREARALIFSPDESPPPAELEELPRLVRCVVDGLSLGGGGPGWAFAVLAPRSPPPASTPAPRPPSRSRATPLP